MTSGEVVGPFDGPFRRTPVPAGESLHSDPLQGETLPDEPLQGEVGNFRKGDAASRFALSRLLVGRVIVARIGAGMMFLALLVLALAVVTWLFGPQWLAILIGLFAVFMLVVRALVMALLRRLAGYGAFGQYEQQVHSLVSATGGDLRRELRRNRIPAGWWSFPLLVVRLFRSHGRRELFERMRGVDIDRIVPAARVDELHSVLRSMRPPGR